MAPYALINLGYLYKKIFHLTHIKNFALILLIAMVANNYIILSKDIINHSRKIVYHELPSKKINTHFAFYTKNTDGFLFHKVGISNNLIWLNSGWGQDYLKYSMSDLPVYFLDHCNKFECEDSNYLFIDTNNKVSFYLNERGTVDLKKLIPISRIN